MGKSTLLQSVLAGVFLLAGCGSKGLETVATAGSCRIMEKDVGYRQAVLKITEEGRVVEPGIVLSHLIKPCVGAEIMKKHGKPVTPEVLETEAKRIDESSLMPDVLKRIKEVFGKDRNAYLQDYVMPIYVNRVLPYDIVRWNKEIQAYKRAEAQVWLDQVSTNSEAFASLGKQKIGQEPGWARVSRSGGWEPFDPKDRRHVPARGGVPQGSSPETAQAIQQQQRAQENESMKWVEGLIENHLKVAKPGAVLPEVIEFPESFLVARYEKRDGDAYLLRVVGFPKREFDDFFFEAAKEFPIRVRNKVILDEMLRLVPWTQKFSLTQE